MAVCECLREESDLQRLVLEVAEDAAKSGRFDEKRWFQSDGIDFTGAKLVETKVQQFHWNQKEQLCFFSIVV